jgi:hypothetical protein
MRVMPITDAFFLLMESRRTPMHVGGLNLFTLPKDIDDASFLAKYRLTINPGLSPCPGDFDPATGGGS